MKLIGQRVSHKKYGAGAIKTCDQNSITVYFDAWGAHTFAYPRAFEKELRAVDPAFDRAVREELERGE